MNSDTPTQSSDRLDEIIAEYLAAEEIGNGRSSIIEATPELPTTMPSE